MVMKVCLRLIAPDLQLWQDGGYHVLCLHYYLRFKNLFCLFTVQPDSRMHLSNWVSARFDRCFGGEDVLLPLGCIHACHLPWATLIIPEMVAASSGGGVQGFPPTFLPAHPTQVPVLTKKSTV